MIVARVGKLRLVWCGLSWVLCGLFAHAAAAQDCAGGSFDSTFALIQKAVFDNHGCTNQICHGAPGAPGGGGLDLRPEVAYDNLIEIDAASVPGWQRVVPGRREASLLFINLAA